MYNFPLHELTVQKRVSQPVCSASHIHEFSYDEEPQTLIMSFEETEGSRGEMERASNDNSFWGAETLKDVVSMKQPLGTTSRARLSPACWLPSSSSRDSCHPATAQPHCWSVLGQDDSCFSTVWQPPPATSGTDLSSGLSPALSPVRGTDRHWSPRRGENSCSKAIMRKMQTPSRGSSLS